jgi:F0F1-type ATP synthase membrane subunit b/b'
MLEEKLKLVKAEIDCITKERDELQAKLSSLHQTLREVDNTNGVSLLDTGREDGKKSMEEEDEEERAAKNREAYLNVMVNPFCSSFWTCSYFCLSLSC